MSTTVFLFELGDRVRPALRHPEHDRHIGLIVERRMSQTIDGITIIYGVRWQEPGGAIDTDIQFHYANELACKQDEPCSN